MRSRLPVMALALLVAAAASMTALAGNGGNYTFKLNQADKLAARAVVLHRADLPSPSGWRGGPIKPDRSPPESCPSFHPRLADLVVTGDAEEVWRRTTRHHFLELDSGSQVFQTALMVRHDWQRNVVAPGAIRCASSLFVKGLATGTKRLTFKFVSFGRVRFHHIAPYTAALRGVATVTGPGGPTVPAVFELVLLANGETEGALIVTGVNVSVSAVSAASVRAARIMARRLRA